MNAAENVANAPNSHGRDPSAGLSAELRDHDAIEETLSEPAAVLVAW
jgi:hypothetical protein